jgi:hypothetical protein
MKHFQLSSRANTKQEQGIEVRGTSGILLRERTSSEQVQQQPPRPTASWFQVCAKNQTRYHLQGVEHKYYLKARFWRQGLSKSSQLCKIGLHTLEPGHRIDHPSEPATTNARHTFSLYFRPTANQPQWLAIY